MYMYIVYMCNVCWFVCINDYVVSVYMYMYMYVHVHIMMLYAEYAASASTRH